MIGIFADGTADLTPALMERYNLRTVLFYVRFGELVYRA